MTYTAKEVRVDSRLVARAFGASFFKGLGQAAKESSKLRRHWNIHADYSDCCQKLFNCIQPNSYIRPHLHNSSQGPELLVAVAGSMCVVFFDENGSVSAYIGLSVDSVGFGNFVQVVEVPVFTYHSVFSLAENSVLLEIKNGPYDPAQPKIYATWAPEEGSEAGGQFLTNLKLDAASVLQF